MRLIDADALKTAIQAERDHLTARGQTGAEHILCHHAYRLIDDAPTVDAVPVVHGHWIPGNTPDAFWVCSHCGFPSEAHGAFKLYKYCPNCGARMDKSTQSNDSNALNMLDALGKE